MGKVAVWFMIGDIAAESVGVVPIPKGTLLVVPWAMQLLVSVQRGNAEMPRRSRPCVQGRCGRCQSRSAMA